MAAISCRDMGSICDWFIRDPDDASMIIAIVYHNEINHKDGWKNILKMAEDGKMRLSDIMTKASTVVKWQPGDEVKDLSLACNSIGPKTCKVTVTGKGFPAFSAAFLGHVEAEHPEFFKKFMKKRPLSQFFDELRMQLAG
jgi:predicted small metal-binding protein